MTTVHSSKWRIMEGDNVLIQSNSGIDVTIHDDEIEFGPESISLDMDMTAIESSFHPVDAPKWFHEGYFEIGKYEGEIYFIRSTKKWNPNGSN